MADNETKVTLTGEDKSGPAFKSMQKNVADTIRQMEKFLNMSVKEQEHFRKRAADTNRTYQGLLEAQVKSKKAFDENLALINKNTAASGASGKAGTQATNMQTTAAKALSRELQMVAGRYLSVGAAIAVATKGYAAFADESRKISQLRNATDATTASATDAIKAIRSIGIESAVSFEAAHEAFTNLRETMDLSSAEALKLLPKVIAQAHASNASLGQFSKSFGDYMRNMKAPIEESDKALEMMTYSAGKLGMNLDKMGPNFAKLAETGRRWGYESIDGMARLNAMAAESSKIYGDSAKGGKAMINLLQELGSDTVGEAMNKPMGMWRKELEKVKREGKYDVVGYAISKYGQLLSVEQRRKVLSEETFTLTERFLEKNHGQMFDMINDVRQAGNGFSGLAKGLRTAGDAQSGLDRLTSTMQRLLVTVGEFLDTIGVTTAINTFVNALDDINTVILKIQKNGFSSIFKPKSEWTLPFSHKYREDLGKAWDRTTENPAERLRRRVEEQMTPEEREQLRQDIETDKAKGAGTYQPSSYQGGATYQPISLRDDARRGVAWVAGKLQKDEDLKQRGIPGHGGVRGDAGGAGGTYGSGTREGGPGVGVSGMMPGGAMNVGYGGAADSKFLRADFRGGGGGGGVQTASLGGGGRADTATDSGRIGPQYQPAGPAGPGNGSAYGGDNKPVPVAPGTQGDQGRAASSKDSERIAAAKAAMKDQLVRDGLSPDKAEEASNLLAGQALSESELKPNTPHDNNTGYGIYGAGKGRRDKMFKWLAANGYAKDSLEGQSRYMAHEVMTDKTYSKSRQALENATPENRTQNTKTLIDNFERPKDRGQGQTDRRVGRTNQAAGVAAAPPAKGVQTASTEPGGGAVNPPGTGANQGTGSTGAGTIPQKFGADIAAMTNAGAKPEDIQTYLSNNGVNTNIATCGQFMAQQVKAAGGKPPPNAAVASNWNNWGGAGYQEGNMNVAVKQGVSTGQTGSHVTAAVAIRDKDGNITGYRGVGVNQGRGGVATAKGGSGRNIVTSIPLKIGTRRGEYQIRNMPEPKTGAPAAPAGEPATAAAPAAPAAPTTAARPSEVIPIKYNVDDAQVQHERANMRVHADRTWREARWNSWSDTGAA
jgi:Phage tail lysozyme